MNNTAEMFGLTYEQSIIMYSIQYQLVLSDCLSTIGENKRNMKKKWMHDWLKSMNDFLSQKQGEENINETGVLKNANELERLIKSNFKKTAVKTPFYLILLEATLFRAYFPIKEGQKAIKGIRFKNDKYLLELYAKTMHVDIGLIDKFDDGYNKAIKGISKYWFKIILAAGLGAIIVAISAGFAAPFIATLFAGELVGAAAISAGLAALGGGAIAAGGFGMAGGIAVIVGGGALLGSIIGSQAGRIFAENPNFVMSQAAKMEVVLNEIVILGQKDIRLAQELIKEQRQAISDLQKDVIELKTDKENNAERIKNIEKSIKYLKRALNRNDDNLEKSA